MGKKKKQNSELDAILEQLKRSYASDSDTELEDSLLDDEESEEDTELSSILAKIFSDENDDISRSESISVENEIVESVNELSADEGSDESGPKSTIQKTEIDNVSNNTDEIIEDDTANVNIDPDEEDMTVPTEQEDVDADEIIEKPTQVTKDTDIDIQNDIIIETTIEQEAITDEEQQKVDDVINNMLRGTVFDEDTESLSSNDTHTVIRDIAMSQSNILTDIEQADISNDISYDSEESDTVVISDTLHEEDTDVLVDQDSYDDDEAQDDVEDDIPVAHIVLDPEQYTTDPLQLSIGDLRLIKYEDDILDAEITVSQKQDTAAKPSESISIDSEDVSLLVKFGYADEVDSQIGRGEAKKAFFDKEKSFAPEKHKTPFGFTGKEFSSKSQIDDIRKKYRSDRFNLLVMLIALSAFTVISFIAGMMFEFSPEKATYYLPLMAFDFLLTAISAIICIKRMISGAIAVSHFEANSYSILLITAAEYVLYNLLSSFVYVINSNSVQNSFAWISGSYVLSYFSAVMLCDFLNCSKEAKTFELMASCDTIYTAEKLLHIQEDDGISRSGGYTNTPQGTFRVRRTSMIGGYFKKTSASEMKIVSPIYMLGIVPSIALILSCCSAILTENIVYGIQSFMMISILCMPLPCICLGTLLAFIKSYRQLKNNVAFVGQNAEEEFATASLLVFDDTEAMEISSYKEINPAKNVGDLQQKLSMAYSVLKMLDGPLGQLVPEKYISQDGHELIINSITDNGINIYFDSSSNILIGDKQYMLANNLKVKTDVNLTTATKGSDRCVIYMAFDGKPQLGFVLTCKIKSDFLKMTSLLDACRIAIYIESYEPEVNDVYFEQNKASDLISVHKPSKYQKKSHDAITDSSIIAKDALSLTKAISECRNAPQHKKRLKNSNLISSITGAILSILIVVLICLNDPIKIFDILREHPTITLYISMIISAIPAIIMTIKEYKRK